jgi:hypothetical protein
MKVHVSHSLDDPELVQAMVEARRKPVGVRALILGFVDVVAASLFLAGWHLLLSRMFAVPDPRRSAMWIGILVCLFFAFALLSAQLRTRFTSALKH